MTHFVILQMCPIPNVFVLGIKHLCSCSLIILGCRSLYFSDQAKQQTATNEKESMATLKSLKMSLPRRRHTEPNLYHIPRSLRASYGHFPWYIQLGIGLVSFMLLNSSSSTMSGDFSSVLATMATVPSSVRELLFLFLKTAILGFSINFVMQGIFLPPDRVSTDKLRENYFLPSPLSQFDHISLARQGEEDDDELPLGVHFVEYKHFEEVNEDEPAQCDGFGLNAVYMNHGFGASSLSWIPTIPKLAAALQVPIVLGHDAPGFGFTDRRKGIYTTATSAKIGTALLERHGLHDRREDDDTDDIVPQTVLLLGHSMGCRTTLRMALAQPLTRTVHLVLVAPALGLRGNFMMPKEQRVNNEDQPSIIHKYTTKAFRFIQHGIVFALRRIVGQAHFWKVGLRLVWGNPNRLSNSDAVRFQWPSIGLGWESGLLDFVHEQLWDEYNGHVGETDEGLMQLVLERPNIQPVQVIWGTKDLVIPASVLYGFCSKFPSLPPVIELEGSGHDPFEEQVDEFCSVLLAIMKARSPA
jgi:pimeloyl-ACP methyl ester carboxylesterase